MLILILYIAKKEKTIHLRPGDYLDQDVTLGKDYVRVCLPMLLVQGLWGVNTALQTVILGHMASNAIAANSVASTLFLLVKSMAVGASSSASVSYTHLRIPTVSIPEFTQLESGKSMIRYLPPKGTAGLASFWVSA